MSKYRSGESFLRESKHLSKINDILDLDYELDSRIRNLITERRHELLDEIRVAKEYNNRRETIKVVK